MAIARKPKKTELVSAQTVDEKTIEALIKKGGSSTQANQPEQDQDDAVKPVLLRLYQSQIDDIENIIEALPKRKRPSRHAYIVQAIEEKIHRDQLKRK